MALLARLRLFWLRVRIGFALRLLVALEQEIINMSPVFQALSDQIAKTIQLQQVAIDTLNASKEETAVVEKLTADLTTSNAALAIAISGVTVPAAVEPPV